MSLISYPDTTVSGSGNKKMSLESAALPKPARICREHSLSGKQRAQGVACESLFPPETDTTAVANEADLRQIWNWNAEIPISTEDCVHDVFAKKAQETPQAPAICAWDGDMTYGHLDELSTTLAHRLRKFDVRGTLVPLCFDKSKWVPVAALGLMKAGAGCVNLDTSVPEERLKSIVEQISPRVILTSVHGQEIASSITKAPLVSLTEEGFSCTDVHEQATALEPVEPSSTLYVNFTSGSTGKPKGAIVTHANFCSAISYQQFNLGFRPTSRVFDLVSYAFDVAWSNLIHTLTVGGCLCIPSQDDVSLLDVGGSIDQLRANFIHITPTVARLLDPSKLIGLNAVLFIGEALSQADVSRWGAHREIYNTYGPAECSVTSTIAVMNPEDSDDHEPAIGTAVGANAWIVDPETGETLTSVGSIGELWLEGPIVGAGYLNGLEQTAAAFVEDPPWLLQGSSEVNGRRGRLYKTGDLVRYTESGSLVYHGRKDTQVKIRGQRVELGDVEYHVRQLLSGEVTGLVAEVISPRTSPAPILAVFLAIGQAINERERKERGAAVTLGLNKALARRLPTYMIPARYIPLASTPMTATGKTDRKVLRDEGARLVEQETQPNFDESDVDESAQPKTVTEKELQLLWASTLGIMAKRISRFHSFLKLGGDSISAIRMVAAARQQGVTLSVADVFRFSELHELAAQLEKRERKQDKGIVKPFSLLKYGLPIEKLREYAAELCSVPTSQVDDIMPCTALQEGLLATTAHKTGDYVSRVVVELRPNVDLEKFKRAWEKVAVIASILRTRIVDLPGQGMAQVVLSIPLAWRRGTSVEDYEQKQAESERRNQAMTLGCPLAEFGIIEDDKSGKTFFSWTQHHALYDAWTLPLVQEAVEQVYQAVGSGQLTSFHRFVGYLQAMENAATFWRQEFVGLDAPQFPTLPSATYRPGVDMKIERAIENIEWPADGVTPSSIIRAAWALVVASQSGSNDTVFAAVVSGRQAPVAGIERIAGPTIATVPIRIRINGSASIEQLLRQIQEQAVQMIELEQTGLQHIQRLSKEAKRACRCQSLLIVQSVDRQKTPSPLFTRHILDIDASLDRHRVGSSDTHALNLVCLVEKTNLQVQLNFDSRVIGEKRAKRTVQQLDHILHQLCLHNRTASPVDAIETTCPEDLLDIWRWNADVPQKVDTCIHELITDRVREQPNAPAIWAWDGELTYCRLDELSTQLAYGLLNAGTVVPGHTLPLCFEKSMWMPVTMLGVMKAGGVCVALDATQPEERLRYIVEQLDARIILCGASTAMLASTISETAFVVDGRALSQMSSEQGKRRSQLPLAKPSDRLYVVFTSGSTGRPKGVVITHSNFASQVKHTREILRFRSTTRVADFASYAFDVAWTNVFNTLAAGGCICIPSEQERKNDLAGFINRSGANYLDLTPSVASTIDWSRLSKIDTIVLGGELVELDKLPISGIPEGSVVINTYGPAECTVSATAINVNAGIAHPHAIGTGYGLVTWIVNPKTNTLSPIGETGELILEGPLVGQGYLNDAAKTGASFIEDPEWLVGGGPNIPGRRGYVYRTGDLVRYDEDGTVVFVGRQDTQVKLRGQRVELSEVEHHIRKLLPTEEVTNVIAEVVSFREQNRQVLIAFLAVSGASDSEALRETGHALVNGLKESLTAHLPGFMIPSAYIPVHKIPSTTTGKVDRQALRQMAVSIGPDSLTALHDSGSTAETPMLQPTTKAEMDLQSLWSSVLEVNTNKIGSQDNFFRLGGDSIAAMRLVSFARRRGMHFTVADVFKSPKLSHLALLVIYNEENDEYIEQIMKPFSLLDEAISEASARQQAAELCSVNESQIQDVLPCTALQEGLLAMTAQRTGDYIARIVMQLQPEVDIPRFQRAWEEILAATPVLRTRIISLLGHGLVQVVVEGKPCDWNIVTSIDKYSSIEKDNELHQRTMSLGVSLTQFGIIEEHGRRFFACTLHHALYDGWSLPLIQRAVEQVYQRENPTPLMPLQPFVRYLRKRIPQQQKEYWEQQFLHLEAVQFPGLSNAAHRPRANGKTQRLIEHIVWPVEPTNITPPAVIRSAWSILVSWQTGSLDTVFGVVSSGRQAPVAGIEKLVGPTIATVPVRVKARKGSTVGQLLDQVQQQSLNMIPFEQSGLQYIRTVSKEAEQACQFQTLLIVQPEIKEATAASAIFTGDMRDHDMADSHDSADAFTTYAIAVTCQVEGPTLRMQLNFDSTVVSEKAVMRMAHQFEHILRQICQNPATKINELDMVSSEDLRVLWERNKSVPMHVYANVHDIFAERVQRQPDAPAVHAWDGDLTYRELDVQSTRLAHHLVYMGVRQGKFVPLCFDKSLWVAVAVMATMKAGAASVALDTQQPEERLKSIVEQVAPQVTLTSESRRALAAAITNVPIIAIDSLDQATWQHTELDLPRASPSLPLYVNFTSGSTGMPKGAVVTHANFSSAIHHQKHALQFRRTSRVLDFTSYAFDVFWSNILHTLTNGGCFCIPSQEDRASDIIGAINRLRVNFAHFTPTLARILEPSELPGLEKIIFSGEALKRSDVRRWTDLGVQVLNTYGPAECTVTATVAEMAPDDTDEPPIGESIGVIAWVVRPDGGGLSAAGTIGELWLEGPLVGVGYLNEAEKTAAAFIEDPAWLLKGAPGTPGRQGRLYRTGDLVRYNENGDSLQYCGRKDTMVKLRGQRVELGEVEYHVHRLVSKKNVRDVVAEVITPDMTKTPSLAVFLVIAGTEDVQAQATEIGADLNWRLSKKLPAFMVPEMYIAVSRLPITATGKTDRKALRGIGKSYMPPSIIEAQAASPPSSLTDTELSLRHLWASTVNINAAAIRLDHSFSDIGGDSIKIMSLAMAIRRQWNVKVKMSALLGSANTLRDMALHIERAQCGDSVEEVKELDIADELASLISKLDQASASATATAVACGSCRRPIAPISAVFLTGATGFFGTQILRQLLSSRAFDRIILLVRPAGGQTGLERIRKPAEIAGWWDECYAAAIEVWEGDLAADKLGLSEAQWKSLCGEQTSYGFIDAIIHNGAAVHWSTGYAALKAVNVHSTLQLLQAAMGSAFMKRFVYISGGHTTHDESEVHELTGYDQTKHVSERLVDAAVARCCDRAGKFSTIKPGLIIGDAEVGVANPDDFLWRLVMTAFKLQARPREPMLPWLSISDVQHLSQLVLRQLTSCGCTINDFIEVTRGMPTEAFWSAVESQLQVSFESLPWDAWIEIARQDIEHDQESHPLWPVQHLLESLGSEAPPQLRPSHAEIHEVEAAVRRNVKYLSEVGLFSAVATAGQCDERKSLVTRTKFHA